MKKIIMFFIFTFLLCGCQNPTARNNEKFKTICSFDSSGINISYEMEADDIDSDVSKLKFKTILPYDNFGIDRSNLKESDLTEIRSSLSSQLGVSKDEVDIKLNENVEISVIVEGASVREYITDDNSSISFTNTVKQFEDKGATCK